MSICFPETTYMSPLLRRFLSSAILLIKGKSKGLFWSFFYFAVALWAGQSSTAGCIRPDVPYLCCKGIWPGFTCQWSIVVSAEQVSPLQWNHQCTQMEARITFLVSGDKLSEEQSRFKELLPCHYLASGLPDRRSKSPSSQIPPGSGAAMGGNHEKILWKVFEKIWEGLFRTTHHNLLYRVPDANCRFHTHSHTRTHRGNGSDMCNCQMSFLFCFWVRLWFPAYARPLIARPAETLFICVKSKWSCQCWVTRSLPANFSSWYYMIYLYVYYCFSARI